MSELIKIETTKMPKEVVEEIKKKAASFDFIIRGVFDMAKEFSSHKVEVKQGFEYYSIMLCNPDKAYESISKKQIRGALLLPPKQVVIYREEDKTFAVYSAVEEKDVKELLPEDEAFQKGLRESCRKITELIKSSA